MPDSFAVFVARRAVAAVSVAVAVSALTFLVLHGLAPENFDDPQPLIPELGHYLVSFFLHGQLGISSTRPFRPVADMLRDSLAADVSLLVGSMAVGLTMGIAAATVCVRRPGSLASRALQGLAAVALCAPVYVVGLL